MILSNLFCYSVLAGLLYVLHEWDYLMEDMLKTVLFNRCVTMWYPKHNYHSTILFITIQPMSHNFPTQTFFYMQSDSVDSKSVLCFCFQYYAALQVDVRRSVEKACPVGP